MLALTKKNIYKIKEGKKCKDDSIEQKKIRQQHVKLILKIFSRTIMLCLLHQFVIFSIHVSCLRLVFSLLKPIIQVHSTVKMLYPYIPFYSIFKSCQNNIHRYTNKEKDILYVKFISENEGNKGPS